MLMLVISGAPIGGVQAEAAEDGSSSSFDVVLMGDRQTELGAMGACAPHLRYKNMFY